MLYIALLAVLGFQQTQYAKENTPTVTAENSPVNMFLTLTPGLTLEEAEAMMEEYGWDGSYITSELEYTISVDSSPLFSPGTGVKLTLAYANEDTPTLLYAYLFIKTDDGTASCYYFPTDYTLYGGETGFNLTVKGADKLFSSEYLVDTAQEAVDIAYAVVYPDGY